MHTTFVTSTCPSPTYNHLHVLDENGHCVACDGGGYTGWRADLIHERSQRCDHCKTAEATHKGSDGGTGYYCSHYENLCEPCLQQMMAEDAYKAD